MEIWKGADIQVMGIDIEQLIARVKARMDLEMASRPASHSRFSCPIFADICYDTQHHVPSHPPSDRCHSAIPGPGTPGDSACPQNPLILSVPIANPSR